MPKIIQLQEKEKVVTIDELKADRRILETNAVYYFTSNGKVAILGCGGIEKFGFRYLVPTRCDDYSDSLTFTSSTRMESIGLAMEAGREVYISSQREFGERVVANSKSE
jgi:hypothetical protein